MIPLIENPVGLDAGIQTLQEKLKEKLPWLDEVYGRATRNTDTDASGRPVYYPEVFLQTGADYKRLAPEDTKKALAFFKVEDPGRVVGDFVPFQSNNYQYQISIIFWFDLTKVYPEKKYRYNEELKTDALNALAAIQDFRVERIYETAAQVWKDYTVGNLESRGLRHPYGGFRLEGQFYFNVPFYTGNTPPAQNNLCL